MNAVGILGSYISKGVYTVSGTFHPFGGAVDIVVVEQPDGSFKSSPWYIRFGKFQGVLKAKEKVVNIIVNGAEANFAMYLDHKGEAYFLREVDVEGESGLYPSSSGDEAEGKLLQELDGRRILASRSCNYDARSSIDGIEKSQDNGKIVMNTSSRQRILGFVWGRKSIKEDRHEGTSAARVDSLERAKIAADLLEVRWSTNLRAQKHEKSDSSKFSSIDTSDGKDEEKLKRDYGISHVTSAVEGIIGNNHDKDSDTCSEQITNGSQLALENIELFTEVTGEISSLNTKDQVVETSIIGEKAFNVTYEVKSAALDIKQNAKDTVHTKGTISENADSKSQISLSKNGSYYGDGENFMGQRLADETNIGSQVLNISEDKSEPEEVQSSMFPETSKSSMLTLDDSIVLTHKVSHLANGGSGIVGVHTEGLHVTTEVHLEDTDSSMVAENFEIETEKVEVLVNYSQQVDHCNSSVYEDNTTDQGKPLTLAASYTQIISTEEVPGSVKELKSDSIGSSFSSDFQDDKSVDGNVTSKFQNSLNSIGNRVMTKESHIIPSANSDDEQFLFGDFDVSKTEVNGNVESDSQHYNDKEEHPLVYPSSIDEEDRFVNRSYETCTSLDSHEIFNLIASPITIPQSHPISNTEVERLAASLPNLQAGNDNPIASEINQPLSQSVDSNSKSLKWMELCKDNSSSKSGGDGDEKAAEEQSKTEETWVSEELNSLLPNSTEGSPAEATVDPVGNWKLWPFSFRRSSSGKGAQSAVNDYTDFDIKKSSDRHIGMNGEASICKHKAEQKMVRSNSPTSEQLASLNLKEGGNTVTFTFYTAVLGKQQVDARIYLWKWNTRVVISDVDGTITKSDVLGQFMPFVGMDWSQTGVTNLFSAIKENGYQLLFLSARSISQAYHTRQFLFNLKQDGKALPEGPVVISPDGLFPSLYREVIRRAPHEFKIACLERIRELFPPDCNPFYAGFGNRDTDEFSYLKVGIPKGKIFIINPKGEVVVNRHVDTNSYTSLHTLVNGMFPPMTSSEQEDFNSWNFWKLPPPLVDF